MNTVKEQATILTQQLTQVKRRIDEIQRDNPDCWWDMAEMDELNAQGREIARDLAYYTFLQEDGE